MHTDPNAVSTVDAILYDAVEEAVSMGIGVPRDARTAMRDAITNRLESSTDPDEGCREERAHMDAVELACVLGEH